MSLSQITFARLDVLKSQSETLLNGKDFCGCLIQEVIYLGLNFRVGLIVTFLKFDFRDLELNFLDEITEALLGGLISSIRSSTDSLGCLLGLLLFDFGFNLLVGNLFGLLLSSHLIDLGSLSIKLFLENIDDFCFVVFVNEINDSFDQSFWNFVWKFSNGILNIVSLECLLEFLNDILGSKNALNLRSVFLRELLSITFLLSLVDGVEGDAEVSNESVGGNDFLFLGINRGGSSSILGIL